MKKKWGLEWLVVLIAVFALAACGGENEDKKSSNSGKSNDSVEINNSVESDEEVILTFVHWINEDEGQWEPLIEKYESENPGIKIESMPLVDNLNSQDYFKQLDLMASAGEKMDVIMFSNINDLVKRVEAGLVAPIDEFIEAEGIDINEEYRTSYPPIDGQQYGLPRVFDTNVVMINKDHLDEAGLEIPTEWTWDDYRDYAKAMTIDDHYGSYLHTWHHIHSSLKLLSKSEEPMILKEDGSSNADDPMVRASLELRYQLEQEDKSSVPFFEIFSQQMDYRQQFFTQEASMIPIASYMLSEWGQFTPEFEIAWAPWPQNEEGANYASMGSDLLSISKASDHQQEAYDFVRWLTTEGTVEQGLALPSWKDADLDAVLPKIVSATSNPDAVDLESFKNAITSVQPPVPYAPAAYVSEVNNEYAAETEMFLLDEQDLDTTIENIKQKVQAIIDEN